MRKGLLKGLRAKTFGSDVQYPEHRFLNGVRQPQSMAFANLRYPAQKNVSWLVFLLKSPKKNYKRIKLTIQLVDLVIPNVPSISIRLIHPNKSSFESSVFIITRSIQQSKTYYWNILELLGQPWNLNPIGIWKSIITRSTMDDWNFIIQSLHLLQNGYTSSDPMDASWLSGASYQERRGPVHPRRERCKEILRGAPRPRGVWCLSHGSCHGEKMCCSSSDFFFLASWCICIIYIISLKVDIARFSRLILVDMGRYW